MDCLTRRQTLGDLLRRSASRAPGKLAIACGETRWTYAEFDRVANAVAAGLALRGVAKGARVAILAATPMPLQRCGLRSPGSVLC